MSGRVSGRRWQMGEWKDKRVRGNVCRPLNQPHPRRINV